MWRTTKSKGEWQEGNLIAINSRLCFWSRSFLVTSHVLVLCYTSFWPHSKWACYLWRFGFAHFTICSNEESDDNLIFFRVFFSLSFLLSLFHITYDLRCRTFIESFFLCLGLQYPWMFCAKNLSVVKFDNRSRSINQSINQSIGDCPVY